MQSKLIFCESCYFYTTNKWRNVKSGRIVVLYPDMITNRFGRILWANNIPHFRFHDLRHYSANVLHALGIPDAYIMERGGWALCNTDNNTK